jgi:hypothetical protein
MKKGYRILIFFLIAFLILSGFIFVIQKVRGATNIVSSPTTNRWAWNDIIGWIDSYSTSTVMVVSDQLQGYASSSIGDISFDCATGPVGSSCSPVAYKVSNNGGGALSGWAWSDTIGWISFCGNSSGGSTLSGSTWVCPSSPTYQATVNSEGQFFGWVWNDVVGWISFNCSNPEIIEPPQRCVDSDYRTQTTWNPTAEGGSLISSTFNTGVTNGAAFNYILWRDILSEVSVGSVCFQFATSGLEAGPWNFTGSGGTDSTYYCVSKDTPVALTKTDPVFHELLYDGKQYFRYKIFINTDAGRTASPVVTDVIVNWSP